MSSVSTYHLSNAPFLKELCRARVESVPIPEQNVRFSSAIAKTIQLFLNQEKFALLVENETHAVAPYNVNGFSNLGSSAEKLQNFLSQGGYFAIGKVTDVKSGAVEYTVTAKIRGLGGNNHEKAKQELRRRWEQIRKTYLGGDWRAYDAARTKAKQEVEKKYHTSLSNQEVTQCTGGWKYPDR